MWKPRGLARVFNRKADWTRLDLTYRELYGPTVCLYGLMSCPCGPMAGPFNSHGLLTYRPWVRCHRETSAGAAELTKSSEKLPEIALTCCAVATHMKAYIFQQDNTFQATQFAVQKGIAGP